MDQIDFCTTPFYGRGRILCCQARNGERRKRKRKIVGNSFPSRLPTTHPLCFSCSLFIAPSPLSERLEMAMRPFHSHKSVFLCVCAQYAIWGFSDSLRPNTIGRVISGQLFSTFSLMSTMLTEVMVFRRVVQQSSAGISFKYPHIRCVYWCCLTVKRDGRMRYLWTELP